MLRLPSRVSRRGWLLVVAGVAVRGDMRGLFEGLVPAEVIEAYDRLLASNGCAKDQADALVGGADLVAALTSWGMAHIQPHTPADPAWLRPASPDLALQGVLVGHQNRLARDQELLLDGHRRLADVQASFGAGMNARPSVHLVTVISDRAEISALSASLMNTARKDWMTLENLNTEMPLTEDFAEPPLPVFGGRVRCRSIYEASVMDDPVARRIVQSCSEQPMRVFVKWVFSVAGHGWVARWPARPLGVALLAGVRVGPGCPVPWSSGSTELPSGLGVPAAFIRACGGGGGAHAQKRVWPEGDASFAPDRRCAPAVVMRPGRSPPGRGGGARRRCRRPRARGG